MESVRPRRRVIDYLRSVPADYAGSIADSTGVSVSTVRRVLRWLEDRGVAEGTLHDERNTGGRRRIYFRLTDERRAITLDVLHAGTAPVFVTYGRKGESWSQ